MRKKLIKLCICTIVIIIMLLFYINSERVKPMPFGGIVPYFHMVRIYSAQEGVYPPTIKVEDHVDESVMDKYPDSYKYLLIVDTDAMAKDKKQSGYLKMIKRSEIDMFYYDKYSPFRRFPFLFLSNKNIWLIASAGPDHDYDVAQAPFFSDKSFSNDIIESDILSIAYDPTNGANSSGDIVKIKNLIVVPRQKSIR